MRATWWLLSATIVCACGPSPKPVVVTSCPTPAEPSVVAAPCVISGNGDYSFFSEYDLYLTRESKDAVAVVHHPGAVGASWSDLPEPSNDDKARAKIELDAHHGLRFTGFATLAGRGFHVVRRIDVQPGHVWVRAASPVEIRGAKDGRIFVAGYDESFRATTTCENLTFTRTLPREKDDVVRSGGRPIYLGGPTLHLAANAGSCALVALPAAWTGSLQSFESRDGWMHVRGGGTSFVFDGWSPLAELTTTEPDHDRDTNCPADDTDRCSKTAIAKLDADVTLTPGVGTRIATLEKGTKVDVVAQQGDYSAFELPSKDIVAPATKRFWVRASSLDPAAGLDGCPE